MNKIIALSGHGNVGKTTTIRLLYDLFLSKGAKLVTTINGNVKGNDFTVVIKYNNEMIGITSYGDYYDLVYDNLKQVIVDYNCSSAFCACRTKGGTIDAINNFSNYSAARITKKVDTNSATQTTTNTKDAQILFNWY